MDHKPLIGFNDGLDMTFSDLRKDENGNYIIIHFDRPNNLKRSGYDHADFRFPGTTFSDVDGFSEEDLKEFRQHIDEVGQLAYEFSEEDENA